MEGEKSIGMACFVSKEELKEWNFDLRKLGPDDVEMKVVYCGVCHSDIHTIKGDWGKQNLPLIPGHEILGYVTKVGGNVTKFKVGDRVGVGAQCFSCLECSECNSSRENYCTKQFYGTYGAKFDDGYISQGGYAHHQRTNQRFVVKIPDSLSSAKAAPLLCAGITTYAPLKYLKVGPGMKIGVIGIGGLGHLALKFARAMGAHVVALSSSDGKREEVLRLGAHEFLNHTKEEELQKAQGTFDAILCTVSGNFNLQGIMKLIKAHGTFSNVGLPEGEFKIPAFSFLKDINIKGTLIGSPSEIEEMLEFCALHSILPEIEIHPLKMANEVIQMVLDNKARYRYVLSIDPEYDNQHSSAK